MILTLNVKCDIVRVLIVLGADLTLIDSLVHRSNVLNHQTPLVRSLAEVDADPRVRCEREQSYRQRMNVLELLPRDLEIIRNKNTEIAQRKESITRQGKVVALNDEYS